MFLSEKDVQLAELHRRDLRREAKQERLAQASRPSRSNRKLNRQTVSLLARIWLLF